jgi:hypothetical protein
MKRATCFMALTASGDSLGSALNTCTWSGQTCKSATATAAADVGGQVPRIGQQHSERDRSGPRVGTDSVMQMSQHKMVTFVNGNVGACRARLE